MFIACLNLESTLMPEVWLAVADQTGLSELRITTREEPDVEALMAYRINILRENGITLKDFQEIVAKLKPLDGAVEFMNWLEETMPSIILTDALWPLIQPMIAGIGSPTTLCHELEVDDNGFISEAKIRVEDQKTKTVLSLKQLNYTTIAIGDSFNDLGMLRFADHGIVFNGSDEILAAVPELQSSNDYKKLKKIIEEIISI